MRKAARLPAAEALAILRSWAFPPQTPEFQAAAKQLGLWEKGKPWTVIMRWLCVGCTRRPVRQRRTYCKLCLERISKNLPTDLDEYLTDEDYQRVARAVPSGMPMMRRERSHETEDAKGPFRPGRSHSG